MTAVISGIRKIDVDLILKLGRFLVFLIFLFMYYSPIYFFIKPAVNSKNKNSKL